MGAPGTLIPAEVPSCHLPNFGLNAVSVTPQRYNVAKVGTSGSEVASFIGSNSEGQKGKVLKRNQTERFEYDFGQLLPSLSRSNEGPSGVSWRTSPAQKLQIKDVSDCVISAAKNPEFAQKLHAVLLNSSGPSFDNLLNVNNQEGESQVCETVHLLDADMLIMSNNEERDVQYDNNANHIVTGLQTEQEIMYRRNNIRYSLPSESTSESHSEDVFADNSVGKVFINFFIMV